MCHICAILNGVAGIIVFSAPSALSSAWFPPEERTTATGIAIVFNNLGNALSFLAAPAIVPDPKETNKTSEVHALLRPNTPFLGLEEMSNASLNDNDTELCPIIEADEMNLITSRVSVLMYTGKN